MIVLAKAICIVIFSLAVLGLVAAWVWSILDDH